MKVSLKPLATLLLLSVFGFTAFGQTNNPIKMVGNVNKVDIDEQEVNITTDNAYIQLGVYSPSIVRVRMDKAPLAEDFSYAVVGEPVPTKTKITQDENEIIIRTDSLVTRIGKKPFSVGFYTPGGKVINKDEEGLTTSWIEEEVTTYKEMQEGERFIGLGEKTGGLDRAGTGYTHYNTDAFGYTIGQDPIYSTIPFYIGIHDGLNYGVFLDNSYQSDFNFGASNNRFSSFGARGGEMDYFFIYHTDVEDIITSYTYLTGRMPLPPLWSLGYQQNRYSYYPETEVMRIAQTLREKKIPADGITLDIHYMDAYKLFTWDNERFPNPLQMNRKLEDMGFKTTVIVDPGIKVEPGYGAYERGKDADIFLEYPDGEYYTGQVWPGWTHFPDFTDPQARDWWKSELKAITGSGVDGIWNDMNEIATWGQKMPNNILFNFDGHLTTHLEGRNVYGMQMARASYEGARAAMDNKRPFILTRAGFAGLQRYTALWTGDNRSEDDHMLLGVRLLNSLGVSGVPFTGMDVGGFTGNPSIGLYSRWIQFGAFIPYFRNHTGVNTKSSEPWAYGEEVTEIARNFISLRYKLLPYIYSTFYEATQTGHPIMRTLAIDYTHEAEVYDPQYENQYLFGEAIMVAPFVSTTDFGKVYFPKGKWYNFYTGEVQRGEKEEIIELAYHRLPLYVKESSIIPMQSLIQSTAESPTDTLTVHIYKGDVNNSYVYYEDDGITYDYLDGQYYKRLISYDARRKNITFGEVEGEFKSNFNNLKIVLHGFDDVSRVRINGKRANLNKDFASFIDPISRFDPQGVSNPVEGYDVKSIVVKNERDKFTLSY
ncbi:alpha-glucosidase [Pontibacter ummariensis]|uniref:Alpha-glucosidase n=1 Tax=Pontibacter ummariensis TaxID=1610492 RepID=A0A239I7S3_9BACT|nr:glycoside hydrolase family 31 protein [Pontibacter ummariensis]PRY09998.1 alpha-glucosidase [Pontibacter ummariensis]SNS89640.1 alpha-glucosidase [Pontibacter ummariensis]